MKSYYYSLRGRREFHLNLIAFSQAITLSQYYPEAQNIFSRFNPDNFSELVLEQFHLYERAYILFLDKELESTVKMIIAKEDPTIIPPEQYKQRFRQAMEKYFIALVPDANSKIDNQLSKMYAADQISWMTKD